MGILSLRMPDSLHNRVKRLSKTDKVSLNQFINSAITEKLSALETEQYLSERSKRGELDKYLKVLTKVSNK
jgi:predicted DNA-binding protein